jgi:hypothetical protein
MMYNWSKTLVNFTYLTESDLGHIWDDAVLFAEIMLAYVDELWQMTKKFVCITQIFKFQIWFVQETLRKI